ncbi:hypothetical protein [Xanthomarina sp. GH4-25]|uniref:hypothetical protein n=1 Tax=Xanthomarina sp. GH4-25 TaxID=3349335 RepID=UPI003877B754
MKKINKLLFLFALCTGVITTSCSEDDYTGDSMINFTAPTVALASSSAVDVPESMIDPGDGYDVSVTVSIPEAVKADIYIPLVKTGGTLGSDYYELGTIALAAGSTSGTGVVTVWDSGMAGAKTLQVGASDNVANANVNDFTVSINLVDDTLNSVLDWSGEVVSGGNTYSLCDVDFDLLVMDSMGNDTGIYDAATGDCPEYLNFDSTLADGVYTLVVSLYDNPLSSLGLGAEMPVTLNYNGSANGTIILDDYTTNSTSGDIEVATVTKNGFSFTVTPL